MKKKLLFYAVTGIAAVVVIGALVRVPVVGNYVRGWINPA